MKKKLFFVLFFVIGIFSYSCVVVPVARGPYPPPTTAQEEMVPEVVYNEPLYYPAPIYPGYAYDYFMYMRNGIFVDLVFYRSGVRYSPVIWHHGGARMNHTGISNWHRNYRVPSAAMVQHRQKINKHTPGPPERKPTPGHAVTPSRPGTAHAAQPPEVQRANPPASRPAQPSVVQPANPSSRQPAAAPAIKQPPARQPQPAPAMRQPTQQRQAPPARRPASPPAKKNQKN